ncbi:MAG: hypothetical protein ACJA1Z_002666 [Patiriisocius sp.]|jgi:hypothetical protein
MTFLKLVIKKLFLETENPHKEVNFFETFINEGIILKKNAI